MHTTKVEHNQQNRRWLTVLAAAIYLDCSRNLLDKDRITNLLGIPYARLGRHIRYDVNDLDAFLEASKQSAGVEYE